MRTRRVVTVAIVVLASLASHPIEAGPPTDQVKNRVDRVIKILDDATDVAAAGPGRLGDHADAWIAPRAHPPRGGETASRVRSPMFS